MSRTHILTHALVTAPFRGARFVEYLFRRRDAAGDLYPNDPDQGSVDGPDPDRVLFFGELGELSLGVRTHELSLPAFFARRQAERTGRGVNWSIASLPSARLGDAPAVMDAWGNRMQGCDLVVVLCGITDALRVVSPGAWERQLRDTIDALIRALPRDGRILIGEIPPLDNAGSLSKPARLAAGIHGRLLNLRTRYVAKDYDAVTVVGFPEELTRSVWRPESEEHRYRDTYKVWGQHLATRP